MFEKDLSEGWQIVSGEKEASLKAKLGSLEKNMHMRLVDVGLDENPEDKTPKPKLGLLTINKKKPTTTTT